MQKQETEDRSITTRILRTLYDEVSVAIKQSKVYKNEADFIRDAVREKLERLKK